MSPEQLRRLRRNFDSEVNDLFDEIESLADQLTACEKERDALIKRVEELEARES